MSITSNDKQFVANTYARFPIELVSGKGAILKDSNGKEYIDLGSGIAVNIFGVADDEWQKAVTHQLSVLPHTSNLYYSEPCSTLAELLCERTGMKKVFFSNSGAEANECAIKVARKYAFDKYGDESHSTIITLKNSFHGRTIATLKATGQDVFHTDFGPFPEGFVYAEANNFDDVKKFVDTDKCIAVMMELVQGEGGVCKLDENFVKSVAELVKEKDMLLIIDEVQTGNGRTGELYAYMHYGIQPDIVTTAKGLGGGLPIGATMLGENVENVLTYGSHGSTFGGNPVSCAGACNIIKRIDDKLLNEVKEKSAYIFSELEGAKGVKSVSGLGLMIGVETEKPAKEVANACIEKGVLVLTAKTKVRLLPSLNIDWDDLKKAIRILKEVIAE
ncbi:acetylornithine aminotransferase [Ruminococcus sp. CAG:563]|nr:acetylornithine aminotransferase [Ruminococcus sp. CAG:563]HJI47787.1 aspartate aminotransferase family protein [Oscillospiraceae bacterium]